MSNIREVLGQIFKPQTPEPDPLTQGFAEMVDKIRAHDRANNALKRHLDPKVAQVILASGVKLGGERTEVTIVYVSSPRHAVMAEMYEIEEEIITANKRYIALKPIATDQEGIVDHFAPDELGIMTVFNVPVAHEDHIVRGVLTALAMKERLDEINAGREAKLKNPYPFGISVVTGTVISGAVGTADRMQYGVFGPAVRKAKYLAREAATINAKGTIFISEAAYHLGAKDIFLKASLRQREWRDPERILITTVYEPIGPLKPWVKFPKPG